MIYKHDFFLQLLSEMCVYAYLFEGRNFKKGSNVILLRRNDVMLTHFYINRLILYILLCYICFSCTYISVFHVCVCRLIFIYKRYRRSNILSIFGCI